MERKNIYIELLDRFMRGELPAEEDMSYGHGSNNLELVSYCFNIIASLGRKRKERNFRLEFRIGCSGIFRAGYMQKQGGRKSKNQFESYSFAGGCHMPQLLYFF